MRIHNWCLCQQDNITSIKILYSLQNNDSSWTVYPTSLEIFHWFGPDFHLFSCIYFKTEFVVFSGYKVMIDEPFTEVCKGNGDFPSFFWLITVEPVWSLPCTPTKSSDMLQYIHHFSRRSPLLYNHQLGDMFLYSPTILLGGHVSFAVKNRKIGGLITEFPLCVHRRTLTLLLIIRHLNTWTRRPPPFCGQKVLVHGLNV